MRPLRLILILVAAVALVAAGCGDEEAATDAGSEGAATTPAAEEGSERGQAADGKAGKDKAGGGGIPAPLAANRAQANEILEEGSLDPKLAELEGFPIVVNQWGSWCPPCRAEFPYFEQSAELHADDVAFLGIDMQDERDAAAEFLAENPVPYPSIFDPDAEQIASLGGGVVSPTTVFIDEEGEIVEVFQGAYVDQAQLEADIDRNLLKG